MPEDLFDLIIYSKFSASIFFYLINYFFLTFVFFFIFFACDSDDIRTIGNFFSKINSLFFHTTLYVTFFSFCGIPPFFNFFIKFNLLYYFLKLNNFYGFFFFLVFNFVLMFFYLSSCKNVFSYFKDITKFIKKNTNVYTIMFLQLFIFLNFFSFFFYDEFLDFFFFANPFNYY